MHGIQNRFSRGFNRRFGRTGGLWQGRYKAKYVEDQSYLDRLVLYVHLNPVNGGLADDPAEYSFGGHREVKREIRNPLVDIDEMLLCFGETKKVARRNYLRAIRIGIDPDAPEIESSWHPFDGFKDDPLETDANAIHVDVLGRSTDLERPALKADEFVRRVCELADFDFEVLASKARDRDTAGKRRIIATLGVERWRQKGTELAAVLKKNQDVVSWWVGEGVRRRLEDEVFSAEIDRLDKELSALLTSSGR